MAVNDPAHAGDAECLLDRLRIDVHDFRDGASRMLLAAGAHLVCDQLAVGQGQFEKSPLPKGGPDNATQLLVGVVVGAKCIAMREEHSLAVEFGDDWVR